MMQQQERKMHPKVAFKLCYGIFRKNVQRGILQHQQRGFQFLKQPDGTVQITAMK
jgi:hypothetical protein